VGWVDEDSEEIVPYDAARESELGPPNTRPITVDEAAEITEEEVLDAFNRVREVNIPRSSARYLIGRPNRQAKAPGAPPIISNKQVQEIIQ